MQKPFLFSFVCCLTFSFAQAQIGTTFWFAVPEVSQNGTTGSLSGLDRPIFLRMTAFAASATITISQPAGGGMPPAVLTIPAGTTLSYELTPWIAVLEDQPANTVLNYGIEIQSTAPITAYYDVAGGPFCLCNPEDFVLKGNNALGTDFWIPGQDTLNNSPGYTPLPTNSFDIVATQNGTTVTITPSHNIAGHLAGVTYTVLLNEGQTYSATAASQLGINHLCGSRVTSDKPIAITEKDDLLVYFAGVEGDDLAGDQIVPVNVLGTQYIPMYGNLTTPPGDKLFITATQNATTVSLNGVLLTTLVAGQTYRMNCPNPSGYLQTSYPTYVYQLSGIGSEVGSALLPQINCTGSNSVSIQQSSTLDFKLNLLVKSPGVGGFLVNGATGVITAAMFTPVPATGGVWYSAQVTLPVSVYPLGSVLTVSNPANLFQLGYLSSGPPTSGADFGYFSDYGGINPNPIAANPDICAGDSLLLFSDSIASATYLWTGPDGFSSTLQNPFIAGTVAADSGVYKIVVETPGCIDSSTISISVNPSPAVNLGDDTTICTGTPITLHSSNTYTGPTYLWNTGSSSATISPTATGAYWLMVTVAGCTGGDTVDVTFVPAPTVNLGDDTTICAPDSLVLAPAIPGDATYTWSTAAITPTINITTTGAYWIRLNLGGCIEVDTIHVKVNPRPVVNLGPDDTLCAGGSIKLTSSDSYNSPTYLWNTGSTAPSISPEATNKYWLAVTVDSCTGSDSVNVTFEPKPIVNLGKDTAICPDAVITLNAAEPAGSKYLWSTGSNSSSIKVSTPGIYKLTVTLDGCSATDSIVISGHSNPTIFLGPDTVLCNGDTLQLSSGNDTALWSNQTTGIYITVTEAGAYWATVRNICGAASDTVNVSYDLCDIWFPSAFTPNGDGLNDIIRAVGNFNGITDYNLSIYNRWGQCVFYTADIYDGWDGKLNGVKQDLGTYFYMMNYYFAGKKHFKKGDIELIR